MNYILFGGTGFIGTHLINLIQTTAAPEDKIYALDIVMPGEEGVVPGVVEKIEGVEYQRVDVRKPIEVDGYVPTEGDIVFNLAAVHRTPGHPDHDYFETNIRGAENVTAWAEENNISRILFTSSIAPYGAAEDLKEETTLPTPNTAYGISKLVAEEIHRVWQAKIPNNCLTIVRPGVVFGKGEHGNFTRMYKGIKGRYFVYAGRTDTIKASIYVKDLVRFFAFRMMENEFPGVGLYNCTYEPAFTVKDSCEAIKRATGLKRKTLNIPSWILVIATVVLYPFGGKKIGLHPARVRKLEVSTNISGKKLSESGFEYKYSLDEALSDWFEDCGKRGLY